MFPFNAELRLKASGEILDRWMYVKLNLPGEPNLIRTYLSTRTPYCIDLLENALEVVE